MDSTDISVGLYPLTVRKLLDRIVDKQLLLEEPPGWSDTYRSQLIESLLLNLPLPSFYINARNDKQWVMIDGSARLNTLKQYVVDQSFSLTKLEFHTDQKGKKFSELIPRWRRRIVESKLEVHLLLSGTTEEAAASLTRRYTCRG